MLYKRMQSISLGLAAVAMFAGTFPATKLVLDIYTPLHTTCLRASCASLFAIMYLIFLNVFGRIMNKDKKILFPSTFKRTEIRELFFVGVMLVFGFPGAIAFALAEVSSSYSAIVLAMLPLFLSAFAVILAKERPPTLFWICSFIAAILVIILMVTTYISGDNATNDNNENVLLGNFWLIIACICAAVGYTKSASLNTRMSGFTVISWGLCLTSPISFLTTLLLWPNEFSVLDAMHHNSSFWGVVYLGLFSMFVGNCLWSIALSRGGIAKISQLQFLQPFLTLFISFWLICDIITNDMIIFAFSVSLAVIIGQRQRFIRTIKHS